MLFFKKIMLFSLLICFSAVIVLSQTKEKKPAKLIGKYTWASWQKTADWETYDAEDYIPDGKMIKEFGKAVQTKKITFILFAGDWCGDSKTEVPKIFKIFNYANVSADGIPLYGVGRDKLEPSGLAEKYKIEKVATLIILKDGKEIGRIVEFPEDDWLEDMLEIINK